MVKLQNIFKAWNSNDWCLAYILFFSITYMPIVPIGFVLWVLTFWKHLEKKDYKIWSGIEIYFISYYLLLAIGLLWTAQLDAGFFKMENKLVFLLFPILFYFSKLTLSRTQIFNILLFSLSFSLILYELIAIFKSIYHLENNHWGYFKDSLFTLFMHRGYYALYLVIGSLICHSKIYEQKNKAIYPMLFILFSIGVLQTYSKAGVLSLVSFNLILLIYTVAKKKIWKAGVFIIIGFMSLFMLLISVDSSLKNRFKQIPISLSHVQLKNNKSSESNQARILMWSASLKSIKKGSILGYGTGDDIAILKQQNKSVSEFVMKCIPEYTINALEEQSLVEHAHFIIQTVRIPLNEKPTIKKIIQIALNIGQCRGKGTQFDKFLKNRNKLICYISKQDIKSLSDKISDTTEQKIYKHLTKWEDK